LHSFDRRNIGRGSATWCIDPVCFVVGALRGFVDAMM
jgi:hypothetical protein